jgi:hypothetical protein
MSEERSTEVGAINDKEHASTVQVPANVVGMKSSLGSTGGSDKSLETNCLNGNSEACSLTGQFYRFNGDKEKALRFHLMACDKNVVISCLHASDLASEAQPADQAKAKALLQRARDLCLQPSIKGADPTCKTPF